jgi:hypothetical protein
MELKDLVVNHPLAKEVVKTGLYLPSIFCWTTRNQVRVSSTKYSKVPAYTAEELLEIMPQGVRIKIEGMRKFYDGTLQIIRRPILRDKMVGEIWTLDYDRWQSDWHVEADTFADAAAKMFLLLRSKGILAFPTDPRDLTKGTQV